MATSTRTMYFAVKLVAQSVGDKKIQPCTVPGVNPTKHCEDDDEQGGGKKKKWFAIGGKQPAVFPGVAGHFTACVLDFNDKEDAACKTVAEAERLVAKKYKAWLADAYDWYVIPATVSAEGPARKAGAK